MILPVGYEKLSDEELKRALVESGYEEAAVEFIISVLRGTSVVKDVM